MDLLNTYLIMNTLSSIGSVSSGTLSSDRTSSVSGNSSFLDILQSIRQQDSTAHTAPARRSSGLSAGSDMDAIFEKAASRYNVDVELLLAIGKAESGFNASALSSAGAVGVMQLMPGTAASLGVSDPYDAEQNIMGGAKYISQMLTRYNGDVKLALAAYNAGPGNVDKYGGIPPFEETQNYVNRVMGYLGDGAAATASSSLSSAAPASALTDVSSSSSTVEIDKETLLTLMELWRLQMNMNMMSGLSSWNSDDTSGADSLSSFL